MSIEQRRQATKELAEVGKFVGPYYHRNDGTSAWGLNAIWEHVFGQHIRYPRPRYKNIIIADPVCFNWLPVASAPGVEHKYLGAFSERGVWVELLRLQAGATWVSTDPRATRLLAVLSGEGDANDHTLATFSALETAPGETLHLHATREMELFLTGLPPVARPASESEQYDLEELPSQQCHASTGSA
jgi:hypothetical protein